MLNSAHPGDQPAADDRRARIALAVLIGPGSDETGQLIQAVGAPDALGRVVTGSGVSGGLAAAVHARLADTQLRPPAPGDSGAVDRLAADLAGRAEEHAAGIGARIVTRADDEWPGALDDLARTGRPNVQPPAALWLRGPLQLAGTLQQSVAVVGARAATGYGSFIASELAYGLAGQGWTVVSSGRCGIDVSAHRAALAGAGATIAVLAAGIDQPRANPFLLEQIGSEGLLITELPPGTRSTPRHRRNRNRLLAAMTSGTVLVEAGRRSAARAVISDARLLRRAVMVVPGPVNSAMSVGCHQELRRPGTALIADAGDIIEAVGRIGAAPDTTGRPGDDTLGGQTVYVLHWDRGIEGTTCYVCADSDTAEQRRDALIREQWHLVDCYDEVPAAPPTDPAAALACWEAANLQHADPDVGVFTIDAVVLAR